MAFPLLPPPVTEGTTTPQNLRPRSNLLGLHIAIVSAKHLKKVNWRHGDLRPYAIFWLDPDHRFATMPDESGSIRPVWNETFTLPINHPIQDFLLTLEIFHSKPSETPKPLVGTLRFRLKDLSEPTDFNRIRTLELRRPSGRLQGKIRMKLAILERPPPPPTSVPDYHTPSPPRYYYSSAPPPPSHRGHCPSLPLPLPPPPPPPLPQHSYGTYSDPYSGYYSGYYSRPLPPPRPLFDRVSSYGGQSGPSAPSYDHKQKGSKMGVGTGLAIGAVAGA